MSGSDSPPESKYLRDRCDELISALFPPQRMPHITNDNILKLTAVFYESRYASTVNAPRLLPGTTIYVADALIKYVSVCFSSSTTLVTTKLYLRLLAEVLRSFGLAVSAIQNDIRNRWYDAITELYDSFTETHPAQAPRQQYQIERWDILFLIIHCQYLILRIREFHDKRKEAFMVAAYVVEGVVQASAGYYGKAVIAGGNALAVVPRKRDRSDWHDIYLQLEQKYFESFINHLWEEPSPKDTIKQELQTAVNFREAFESEIVKKFNKAPKAVQKLKKLTRWVGQMGLKAGPYEENDEYFEYGVLDLMYNFSIRVTPTARQECFEELITAVKVVVDNPTPNLLRVKAIDLFRRINEMGAEDKIEYGYEDDYGIIQKQMKEYGDALEWAQNSRR